MRSFQITTKSFAVYTHDPGIFSYSAMPNESESLIFDCLSLLVCEFSEWRYAWHKIKQRRGSDFFGVEHIELLSRLDSTDSPFLSVHSPWYATASSRPGNVDGWSSVWCVDHGFSRSLVSHPIVLEEETLSTVRSKEMPYLRFVSMSFLSSQKSDDLDRTYTHKAPEFLVRSKGSMNYLNAWILGFNQGNHSDVYQCGSIESTQSTSSQWEQHELIARRRVLYECRWDLSTCEDLTPLCSELSVGFSSFLFSSLANLHLIWDYVSCIWCPWISSPISRKIFNSWCSISDWNAFESSWIMPV